MKSIKYFLAFSLCIAQNNMITCANDRAGVYTLLHHAAANGKIDDIKHLVATGADLNAKDKNGKRALDYAVNNRDDKTVQCLLKLGANIQFIDDVFGNDQKGIYLIKNGADLNKRYTEYGMTFLHYAARRNQLKLLEALIEHGADLNAKDRYGDTPLHYAAVYDSLKSIKFLADKGVDLTAKNHDDKTPAELCTNKECRNLFAKLKAAQAVK